MSKYIPGVFVEDNHFKHTYYDFSWRTEGCDEYQDALIKATQLSIEKSKEEAIKRVDGFEYPKPRYTPVVLKQVVMQELRQ